MRTAGLGIVDVAGDNIQFQEGADFYIVVPELTEKVTYNFFGNPFEYSKRAPGRQMVDAKPDVPDEISRYLTELGHYVELGPQLTPGSNADSQSLIRNCGAGIFDQLLRCWKLRFATRIVHGAHPARLKK